VRNAWYARTQPQRREYALKRHKKIYKWLNWRKDKCEICGFDKSKKCMEVHHMKPEIKGTEMDNEHDCITVCRNCHMMIHTGEITIEEVYKVKNGVMEVMV
jgi:predicted HNH restriction endonuclease